MTLIAGFIASDGALLVSDTEASESGHSRFDVEKIWQKEGYVFAVSGSVALKQSIEHALGSTITEFLARENTDRWAFKDYMVQQMHPLLNTAYSSYVGPNYMLISATLLVIGRDAEGYFLLELDPSNTATFYDERQFHAIGSGSAAAYAIYSLIENYDSKHQSLEQVKLVSHRMLSSCINVIGGSSGVGGDIDMWVSDESGIFHKLTQEELESVKFGVDQWKLGEKETLDTLYNEAPMNEDEQINMPEQLQD